MSIIIFFGFGLFVTLVGFTYLFLMFRHHYLKGRKEKAAKLSLQN